MKAMQIDQIKMKGFLTKKSVEGEHVCAVATYNIKAFRLPIFLKNSQYPDWLQKFYIKQTLT